MRNAIVIGASSGIGRELARVLASQGYGVGLVSRRVELLASLARELPTPSYVREIDVSQPDEAMRRLRALIAEMQDVELFVVNAGIGFVNPDLEWALERDTVMVNVLGFAAMVNVAAAHLQTRGSGHLVGISSIAALRGQGRAPAYGASKAFVSNYLQGLRHRFSRARLPIIVTDVQPGFVRTAMAKGPGLFWVASPEKAARQICDAIRRRRTHVYVTRRWRVVAWIIKAMPDALFHRL